MRPFKCSTCSYKNSNINVMKHHKETAHSHRIRPQKIFPNSLSRKKPPASRNRSPLHCQRLTTPDPTVRKPTRPIHPSFHRARPLHSPSPDLLPTISPLPATPTKIPAPTNDAEAPNPPATSPATPGPSSSAQAPPDPSSSVEMEEKPDDTATDEHDQIMVINEEPAKELSMNPSTNVPPAEGNFHLE